MRFSLISFLLLLTYVIYGQWDINAGLIEPINKKAKISVTSGMGSEFIIDGDINTYWESASPLPERYISRKELNIFLNRDKFAVDEANPYLTNAFDGLTSTKSIIPGGFCEFVFNKPTSVLLLSVKINCIDTVEIILTTAKNDYNYLFLPGENYVLKRITVPDNSGLNSVSFKSNNTFEIFEIAGLYRYPFEDVILDLGNEKAIGLICSRHYNGSGVKSITVLASENKRSWKRIATLNPHATPIINQLISPEVNAQFVKLRFVLEPIDYQKAKLHELRLYDKYGQFGKPDDAVTSDFTFSQSFGINTIWGWGYNLPSEKLTGNKGPNLFNEVARLARNYHSLDWDINKPGEDPGYNRMNSGLGTRATSWLNWDSEYGFWKASGFTIDACIMFNNQYFPDSLWVDTKEEAFHYGRKFAEYFCDDNALVSIMEIGNEPWEYSKYKYRQILYGMSKGAFENSGSLTILPCATQAYDEKTDVGNYISDYLNTNNVKYISGLNTHVYSYIFDYNGNRRAINPEDPRSEVWSVSNMKRFAKSNLHNKPVYVTEFGYDSDGGGDDCVHSVCIGEFEQAIYGVRMALILYRLGTRQFYWYYYANVDYNSILHNRSGLISSYSKGFEKKDSFYAFKLLQKEIGNYYFHSIIKEDDDAYVYAYCDDNGEIVKIVAWRPTSLDHNSKIWIEFPIVGVVTSATYLVPMSEETSIPTYLKGINGIRVNLSGVPTIFTVGK